MDTSVSSTNVLFEDENDKYKDKKKLKIIPENEIYRIRLLTSLLQVREAKTYQEFNLTKKMTQDLIDSLCKS